MRAISTGLFALMLVPTAIARPGAVISMTDVVGGSTSSAPGFGDAPVAPAWGSHADSLRAEALLPAAELRRPLEGFFGRYNTDRALVRRISRAVVRESRRQQVSPALIAAVLVTENTTLRPNAQSSVGAQGLMQVMPMHAGAELCRSSDLVDVDSNICHGTLILARDLRRTSTSTAALLRYNGCVRGTNTPDCRRYPSRVLAKAGMVRRELLAGTTTLALAER
ncbi:MAG: transglycosylase SLT domain-containing protein [Gemmatimonadales bacterium]